MIIFEDVMWKRAEKALSKDRGIGILIKKHGPCTIRPSQKSDYIDDLVSTIINQQLSWKAAETIYKRVKEGLGGEFLPERILETSEKTFRKWGLSNQKTTYVKDLSSKLVDGSLNLNSLSRMTDGEVIEELVKVKGIGVWSAKMFLMFSLARQDIFAEEDLGIQKGIKMLLNKDINTQKMAKYAQRWKPYRTAASWYIWKLVD